MTDDGWATASAVLRLAAQLVDDIQQGVDERGFTDVRPTHGVVFAFLSAAPATTAQLADHLGISKQATSELVHHLVERGYLGRTPDPSDRRARLLVLTARGRACTQAAQAAAERTVARWERDVAPRQAATFRATVTTLAGQGRLRPAW